jgi:hypothetical protein
MPPLPETAKRGKKTQEYNVPKMSYWLRLISFGMLLRYETNSGLVDVWYLGGIVRRRRPSRQGCEGEYWRNIGLQRTELATASATAMNMRVMTGALFLYLMSESSKQRIPVR